MSEAKVGVKVESKTEALKSEVKAKTEVKTEAPKRSAPRRDNRRMDNRRPHTSRRPQRKMRWAIAHIRSTYNNTIITVTDITGTETLARSSGGQIVKADRLESSATAAMGIAKKISEILREKGVNGLYVKVKAKGGHNGPKNTGPGAQAAIKTFSREGFRIGKIQDVTPEPHNGCRAKGGRRGRRV